MKKLFLVATAVLGFSVIALADVEVATNCTFTGNSGDQCYASDGTHNYRVLECKPGETDCGYNNVP